MSFSSQISTAYDAANQATGETTAVTGQPARTVSYSYDADGRRISTTYPGVANLIGVVKTLELAS
ncbi:MAG: RHS repeat domain-containing protein [Verrucomicrobiae bacterium]